MRRLLKNFKTEIDPTEEQKVKIRKTIGTCRFIYNFYLAHNKELHENGKTVMSSHQFRVWLNNEYLPDHPEYAWIKEAYSKAVTQSVNHGQTAFTRFFKHQSGFPKFKKRVSRMWKCTSWRIIQRIAAAKDIGSISHPLGGSESKKRDISLLQKMDMS